MACRSAGTLRQRDPQLEIVIVTTEPWHDPLPKDLQPAHVVQLEPPFPRFPANMCLAGALDRYGEIIYLDSDTFVFGTATDLLELSNAEFTARLSTRFQQPQSWAAEFDPVWRRNLERIEAAYGPVFNIGVCVFRKSAHQRVYPRWVEFIEMLYDGRLDHVYGGEYLYPQIALSLAVAKCGLTTSPLGASHHAFAWSGEDSDSIVYHTNSSLYDAELSRLQAELRVPAM